MDEKSRIEALLPELQNKKTMQRAFLELVKLTKQRLYWHIRKIVLVHEDADDVLQNTYIKVFKSVESFRGDSQLYTWIFKIATNESLTLLAQKRIKNLETTEEFEDYIINNMQADSYYEGDAMFAKFERAILSLPDKQRQVFNMRYFEDMKYSDMAELTGTSEGALKASYHIAVQKIEQFIKQTD